jgi:hypothetical protein
LSIKLTSNGSSANGARKDTSGFLLHKEGAVSFEGVSKGRLAIWLAVDIHITVKWHVLHHPTPIGTASIGNVAPLCLPLGERTGRGPRQEK